MGSGPSEKQTTVCFIEHFSLSVNIAGVIRGHVARVRRMLSGGTAGSQSGETGFWRPRFSGSAATRRLNRIVSAATKVKYCPLLSE
jgi:hypothetical protein